VPVYPVAVFAKASLAVTTTLPATPEVTLLGNPLTMREAAGPGRKVIRAVPTVRLLSVLSMAVKVAIPARVDLTVKATTPLASEVVPETAAKVSVPPRLGVRVTVFPATGLSFISLRVTVTVEVAELLATKLVGVRVTVECPASTAPEVKVTRAVGVIVRLSVVSVAVKVAIPAAVDWVVKVATPLALDVTPPVGAKVPTPVLERETFFPETRLS
jgi:hypothetical protein